MPGARYSSSAYPGYGWLKIKLHIQDKVKNEKNIRYIHFNDTCTQGLVELTISIPYKIHI